MNLIEITQRACDDWWNTISTRTTKNGQVTKTRGEFAQENLRTALVMYKAAINAGINSQFLHDFARKCGYGIVGGNSGIPTGLKSTNVGNGDKVVRDHVFGATLAGNEVLDKFKEWDYDVDYMVNTWLQKNLYYFGMIDITKDEHNRLSANKHSKNQKRNLEHYAQCGIELEYAEHRFANRKQTAPINVNSEVVNQFFDFKK